MKKLLSIITALICSFGIQSSVIAQEAPKQPIDQKIKQQETLPQDAKLIKPVKDFKPCLPPKRMPRKIRNAFELFKFADELQLTDDQIIKLRAFYKKYYSEEAKKKEPPEAPKALDFYEMNEQQLLKYADDEVAKVRNIIMKKFQKIIEIKKILTKEQLEKIRKEFEVDRKSDKPQDAKKQAGHHHKHHMNFSHQLGMMMPFMNPMFPPQPGMMGPMMNPMCPPQPGMMGPMMNPMCPPRPGMMCPQMHSIFQPHSSFMTPMSPMCPKMKHGMKPGKMGPQMNPMFPPRPGMMGPQMCPMGPKMKRGMKPGKMGPQMNPMFPPRPGMMGPQMCPMGQPQFNMMPPFYGNQNCCPFSKNRPNFGRNQFNERPPFFEHLMKLFSCKNDKDSDIILKDKMNKGLPTKNKNIPERK